MFERKEDQRDLDQDSKKDLGILGSTTVQLGQSSRHTFKKPLFKELKASPVESPMDLIRVCHQLGYVTY